MFGRLTRWAIVFLIIFVLFILLVPEEREQKYYCGPVGYGGGY
jgi:competence protein ComGC